MQPNELERERPYIENNIEFTREAYGLNRIVEQEHPGEPAVTLEELVGNPLTVRNFRLWDPEPLLITYNQVQSIRLYYDILDADVDRYYVDGEYRQVMGGRARTLCGKTAGLGANVGQPQASVYPWLRGCNESRKRGLTGGLAGLLPQRRAANGHHGY